MLASPSLPEDSASEASDAAPDPAVLRAERRLRLLAELADIGMELARALRPVAPEDAAGDPADADDAAAQSAGGPRRRDPAEAFARVSRAVRLTLALEAKTDAELCDLKAGVVRARDEERTVSAERRRVAAAKDAEAREGKIRDLVIEAAEAELEDVDALDELSDALDERLDEDVAYLDRDERPLREIVESLCRDLTLRPDWSLWDGEGWVRSSPPARPSSSPFNKPSARPFGAGGGLAPPAPAQRLQPAHDLE